MHKILIIEDEESVIRVLSKILKEKGFYVEIARTKKEALKKLSTQTFDIILSDYRLPDGSGLEILEFFRERDKITPFIIITAYGSINGAVEALHKGANHYIPKPIDFDNLLKILSFYIEKQEDYDDSKEEFAGIIGRSRKVKELFHEISIVSKSDATVLIEGESGTGKELVARAIHKLSKRAKNPFIAVNCSAIPLELFENELFGHEKGAYTGAIGREVGKIELAGEGTLFLDEVGELSLVAQAKLLRVLQEKEFFRVGGTKLIPMKCRIICATNRNLEEMVEKKEFREDLFYRINVVHLKIPPLRERKEDIPLLANHFLNKFSKQNEKQIYAIDDTALDALMEYNWPGNVRELENAIERAVVMCQEGIIKKEHLPPRIFRETKNENELPLGELSTTNLLELEKRLILKVLEEENWNQTKTAERLGISRKQLRTKMKNFGLLP
ncbi:MAG TPA: sigma-54-dependent Fis family transcriptional regulator [Persephonella sp.]|nr:sigma-54-dependent Fis family transcriptional regulator [Hydrogenothermaceae bacterium]HIQ25274.1 sigma-54-dependent Fis family transcriptional regulator [Persephonella sp.]